MPLALALHAAVPRADTSPEARAAIAAACTARRAPWDYVGLVAMGQSLAAGWVPPGDGDTTLSRTQPERNVMLASDDGWPAGDGFAHSMAALTEPMRPGSPASNIPYPTNLSPGCEPPTTYMANALARMWREQGWGECRYAVTNVAIGGASIVHLGRKGDWRSYGAALEEVAAFTYLARAEGRTYGVAAVAFSHGEADAKMIAPGYADAVVSLLDDFDEDVRAITGQTRPVVMIASQQSSTAGGLTGSPVQLLDAARQRPGRIVVTGPKYQLEYADTKHLTARGYQALGWQYARVFDAVVNRCEPWAPLSPLRTERKGQAIRITFHVPRPPLAWDMKIPDPWPSPGLPVHLGRGFEVHDSAGAQLAIAGVAIEGADVVRIDLKKAPTGNVTASYATTGVRGQLADSDDGASPEGYPSRNYCVHFAEAVT